MSQIRLLPLLMAFVAVTLWSWPLFAEVEGTEVVDELEVEAQSVDLDQGSGRAVFEGSVRLRHGALELSCRRLTAEVDDEGHLLRVEASGSVRLRARGVTADADSASYEPLTGVVTLRGDPRVSHSSGTLRGRVIVVHSREGRVSVEDARGVFRLR